MALPWGSYSDRVFIERLKVCHSTLKTATCLRIGFCCLRGLGLRYRLDSPWLFQMPSSSTGSSPPLPVHWALKCICCFLMMLSIFRGRNHIDLFPLEALLRIDLAPSDASGLLMPLLSLPWLEMSLLQGRGGPFWLLQVWALSCCWAETGFLGFISSSISCGFAESSPRVWAGGNGYFHVEKKD